MRLFAFSTGELLLPLQTIKMNQFQDELFEIPIPWYVVDHPEALIVIDGGNPAQVAEDPSAHWGAAIEGCEVRMAPEQACVPTLRRHGFDLGRPTYLVQTHLHSDHVGALAAIDQFHAPRVVAARRELEYGLRPDWHLAAEYIRPDFDRPDADWHFIEDDQDDVDLLGDGSVRLHHTPGHAVGHLSVEIRLPRSGVILLTGDASYTRDHWEERAVPGLVASTVDAVRSVKKLHRIAREREATVLLGHDLEQWQTTVRQGPAFYE